MNPRKVIPVVRGVQFRYTWAENISKNSLLGVFFFILRVWVFLKKLGNPPPNPIHIQGFPRRSGACTTSSLGLFLLSSPPTLLLCMVFLWSSQLLLSVLRGPPLLPLSFVFPSSFLSQSLQNHPPLGILTVLWDQSFYACSASSTGFCWGCCTLWLDCSGLT